MADDPDGWHVVPGTEYFEPAAVVHAREQIQQWAKTPGHWSGNGKHIKSERDIKFKLRADEILGTGATGYVERVTLRSVTMARKKIRIRGMVVEQLREEANIMEKLVHRHIVELVGTYTHGMRELYILTYPAATCNLQGFLDDIEEVRTGTSADLKDASKRFEALGFKGILYPEASNDDPQIKALEGPLSYLTSILGCVTEAVEYVHSHKVRHQDLKPRNVLLSPRQVYLADFGISRDLKDATHSLTEGFPGGTPLYLAPEVIENKKHHPSLADTYSLGCVFLTVASVLYGAPHDQYETVMGVRDQSKKTANLRKYLDDLRTRATATGRAAHDATTCAPKNLLGLIESMLSHEPTARPSATQINTALYDIGGIDQIYHGKCCKKDTTYISQLIDNKIHNAAQSQNAQATRILQLEAQHESDKQLIEKLSKSHETYELRLERERKHVVDQYKKILDQQAKQLEAVTASQKALEAQLKSHKSERRAPKRGGGGGGGSHFSHARFAQFNAVPVEEMPSAVTPPRRRGSRIPLPERPTTPLNPSPPLRLGGPFPRETYSGNSTLQSSINSSYSRTTVATDRSGESETSYRRSPSPESPVASVGKVALSPVLSYKGLDDGAGSDTRSVAGSVDGDRAKAGGKKTWAEMLRLPTDGQKGKMAQKVSKETPKS